MQGYLGPTPLQAKVIPAVIGGRDVFACAQTGSGKTAGFILPLLNRIKQRQMEARAARQAVLNNQTADSHSQPVTPETPSSIEAGAADATESEAKPEERVKRRATVLILVPSRELASQVNANARTYGRFMHCRTVVVYGGVPIEQQITALERGTDVVIATPARLLEIGRAHV